MSWTSANALATSTSLIRDRDRRFVQASGEAFAGNGVAETGSPACSTAACCRPTASRSRGRASWSAAAARQLPAKRARARTAQRPARRQRPRTERRHFPARQPPHPTARRPGPQPGVPGQPWPAGRQREAAPRIVKSRWRAASSVVSAIRSCLTDFWFLDLAVASCAWAEGPAEHCGISPGRSTASGAVPPSPALFRRLPGWLRCRRGGLPRGPCRRGLRHRLLLRRFLLCRCRIFRRCLLRGWWGGLGQRGQVND